MNFTIDVRKATFDELPTVHEPWELAKLLLYGAPHLPLDVEQGNERLL
ncbi:hypothetical protein [Amycolatopsis aidingensis]|nr:hypothetical protein [Amycolatopsis aidingensis]